MGAERRFSPMYGECLETDKRTDEELLSITKPSKPEIIDQLIELLVKFNVDPAITYAVKKLNYVITDYNVKSMTQEQKVKWILAMQEYYTLMQKNGMQ